MIQVDKDKPVTSSTQSILAGLVILIALTPVYSYFAEYNNESRGLIFVCITGVFLMVAFVRRDIIRRRFFVITMFLLYILHLAAIFLIDIPNSFPGFVMFPISIADLYLVIFVVLFVEKRIQASVD